MSSNLVWQPVKANYKNLPDELKFAMRKRFDGHVKTTMDESDAGYLQGLRDAGVKGAQELLDAIAKYGEIEVKEVY